MMAENIVSSPAGSPPRGGLHRQHPRLSERRHVDERTGQNVVEEHRPLRFKPDNDGQGLEGLTCWAAWESWISRWVSY